MSKRAQSFLEIFSLFCIVALAWLAMSNYFRSALQGNWKQNIDVFSDEQYDKYRTVDSAEIEYLSPTIKADVNLDNTTDQNFNLGNNDGASSAILKIDNWGVYE